MNEVATLTPESMGISSAGLPIGVLAILDDRLASKLEKAAMNMSKAEGMVPPHLIGKPVSCYAVLTRALTWRLDPFAVAQSTFTVPGGKIGYEGKLVLAILENSGRIEGQIKFEHYGDWSKIIGRFKTAKSAKGNDYFVPGWAEADEKGIGVRVVAKVKGESEPRTLDVDLNTCHPRNSTLWALRPNQQICYTAARAFAFVAAPSLFMGVPFASDGDGEMIDITPTAPARPKRESFVEIMDQPKATEQSFASDDPDTSAASSPVDQPSQTTEPEEAADDFSVPEAMDAGRKAFAEGRALRAVPPEWRDKPECQPLIDAWQAGWRDAEQEKTAKK
jgi:hypothetical protein